MELKTQLGIYGPKGLLRFDSYNLLTYVMLLLFQLFMINIKDTILKFNQLALCPTMNNSTSMVWKMRMMKVQNEATVNIMQDPALQIKRYEKEIRDLKQELAMHDTLSNRGRINYAAYNQREQ